MGVVVMPPLPPVSSEELQNSRVPSLHGSYPASSLLRTRPPPSRRRTISRGHRLYIRPDSTDSQRDEEGFSSCSMRLGHRAVAPSPAGARRRVSQTASAGVAFTG